MPWNRQKNGYITYNRIFQDVDEVINNKGNLADHMSEIEKKIRGATSKILAETGNKEFKGIKMKAIWQMVDDIHTHNSVCLWRMVSKQRRI